MYRFLLGSMTIYIAVMLIVINHVHNKDVCHSWAKRVIKFVTIITLAASQIIIALITHEFLK